MNEYIYVTTLRYLLPSLWEWLHYLRYTVILI